jgi:hypothetical protein
MLGALSSFALAQKDSSRPVGVPATQWIALGEHAGIVISDYQPGDEDKTSQGLIRTLPAQSLPSPAESAALARQRSAKDAAAVARERKAEDSARGYVNNYFMVKQYGRWRRLSVVSPPQLLGALRPE